MTMTSFPNGSHLRVANTHFPRNLIRRTLTRYRYKIPYSVTYLVGGLPHPERGAALVPMLIGQGW